MVLKKGVYLCGLITALLLTGCSGGYPVKTYEGEFITESEVGILKAPEDIDVVEVDGVKMKSYLLENLAIDYHLLPGEHEVVFNYSGLWAKPKGGADEDRGVETVKSDSQMFRFVAEAGKVYTFSYISPSTRTQAYELAQNFSADLLDGVKVITTSALKAEEASTDVQTVVAGEKKSDLAPTGNSGKKEIEMTANISASGAENVSAREPVVQKGPFRLEALKELWAVATEEEKKEFLRWAFK